MLNSALYPYSQPHSETSTASSPSERFDWADWIPECLHPAIAIAREMSSSSSPNQRYFENEDDPEDEDDDGEPLTADDEDLASFIVDEEDEGQEEEEEEGEEEEEEEEEERSADEDQGEHGVHSEEDMDLFSDEEEMDLSHLQRQTHQLNRIQTSSHAHGQQGVFLNRSLVCLSCKETYNPRGAGTCRECYEDASDIAEALKKEIEELHARIAFLKTWVPEAMEEDCADMLIECVDGSKIRAHRAVLMSRSTVFKAMLESNMQESRTNSIKIMDFTYEVLKLFIHYLYTAEIYPESLEECAVDLLALAEKYNVKQLKSVCERHMISKLNFRNALYNFEYASIHGAKALKQAALSTIHENMPDLIGSSDYQELVSRDAKLVVEIYESYSFKQMKKSPAQ
ncbi:hypothetical protein KP509_07G074900 [Ceratopteris richardii]|uniref:BTB domain-containing protein n=1 Tax=Ceratopteris richardii TaxID=49495 RepID=A0A8T2UGD1_CERRI|nr:hypothetical protein KP509_07G074900 [Ceratopteris richardii]KAH7433560.1 hypothetical protein KP509_07G074900 [Ceratopteris richardii]